MRARRGISLIEILFSVGVVGIGLLGVMALVPVAMRQIGQGNDYDRTSRMGLNALSEFEIRGMANPENWRWFNPAVPGFFPNPPLAAQGSFAIDPLAMSLPVNQSAAGAVFPANGAIWMPRFTLRSLPHHLAGPMSSLHADRIFILRDELVFNLAPDQSIPPLQAFNWDQGPDGEWGVASTDDDSNGVTDDGTEAGWDGSDDRVTTRQADGVYSWMATMTPKLDTRQPTPGAGVSIYYPENFARDYILSIVVYRTRDFDVTNGTSERIVEVAQIYGDGTAGGDLLLRTLPTSTHAVEDLQGVREGNWILLGCQLLTYGGGTSGNTINHFGWYRVDSVDDEVVPNGTDYELNVSVSGPDWPLAMTVKPGPGTTGTQAALIQNVIAVYQKVVRLEPSSLWSN